MKFAAVILMCVLAGCGTTQRTVNPIKDYAVNAKKQENESFKRTIAQETVTHKAQQAKYNDMIKNPEKYADVVDLATGQNINPAPPADIINDVTNPNTPAVFSIPEPGAKNIDCKNCKRKN